MCIGNMGFFLKKKIPVNVHLYIFWTKNYILYTNVPCACMNIYSQMYVSTYIYIYVITVPT